MNEIRSYKRAGLPEFRAEGDTGTLTGYAAVYNTYSQNLGGFVELIQPGAFDEVLSRADVVALVNHDPNLLLGSTASSTLRLVSDDVGLRYDITVDLSDPTGQAAAAKVRTGKMPGSSFSFRVAPDGDTWSSTDSEFPLRTIRSVAALYDVGPVTYPAYKSTGEGQAATALRSLTQAGHTIEQLVAAAEAGELRTFLPGATGTTSPAASNAAGEAAYRARLIELARRANR